MTDRDSLERLRALVEPPKFDSDESLIRYFADRWQHHEKQGPGVHTPVRRSYSQAPWAPRPENLYVALFPAAAGENILDFGVFAWYSSSVHQDLIRDGSIDVSEFYREDPDVAIEGFTQHVSSAEVLTDQYSIVARLREFDLPPDAQWVMQLPFNSAIVSAEDNVIEMIADTNEGYLLLFSVDG